MKPLACFGEKLSSFIIGLVLFGIGIIFVVIGFTILPVIGFVIAAVAVVASVPFFKDAFVEACRYYGI